MADFALLELACLALLAPLALFPTPARFTALLAVPGLWVCRWLVTRHAARNLPSSEIRNPQSDIQHATSRLSPPTSHFHALTPLDAPILLLAFMVLVSLYATYDIAVSLPKIAGLVFGIAVYYAAVRAMGASRRGLGWGVAAHLAMGTGLAGLGLVGTKWPAKIPALQALSAQLPAAIRGWSGAEAGFHANEVAGALLWFVPLALSICVAFPVRWLNALTAKTPPREDARKKVLVVTTSVVSSRPAPEDAGSLKSPLRNPQSAIRTPHSAICNPQFALSLFSLLLMLAVLGLTQSRGAFVGLAVGLVAMLACLGWWGRGIGLAVVAAGVWGVGRFGLERLGELLFGGESIEAVGGINLAGRVEVWSRAIYGIQDFPFTGMGLNTFRRVVHVLYPLFLVSPATDIAHAHNQFLQVALDLGIPGLIAYLALWIAAIVLLVCAWQGTRDLWLRAVTLGLVGSFVAYFVYGLADTVALGAKPGLAFWTLLALCVAVWNVVAQPADADADAAAHLTSRPQVSQPLTRSGYRSADRFRVN